MPCWLICTAARDIQRSLANFVSGRSSPHLAMRCERYCGAGLRRSTEARAIVALQTVQVQTACCSGGARATDPARALHTSKRATGRDAPQSLGVVSLQERALTTNGISTGTHTGPSPATGSTRTRARVEM